MFCVGQVVFSKRGRDKRRAFIIHHIDGEYVYLVDGECRKLTKPKKKKDKHVQMTKDTNEAIREKLEKNEYITDADIRKALVAYRID